MHDNICKFLHAARQSECLYHASQSKEEQTERISGLEGLANPSSVILISIGNYVAQLNPAEKHGGEYEEGMSLV